jgi:hypothetical protein
VSHGIFVRNGYQLTIIVGYMLQASTILLKRSNLLLDVTCVTADSGDAVRVSANHVLRRTDLCNVV